jgi:hypothetical protein
MDSGKAIQLARNADVRLELFLLGTDNRLYHAWQKSASTSLSDPILESWSLSSQLWGQQAKNFTVGHNQDGRLELFYVGKNGGLDHDWQTALPTAANPNTFGQQGQRFGSENAKDLAAALDVNGLQELCYVGSNNGLYFQNQSSPAIAGPGADLNSWVPSYRVNIETDVKAVAMAAQAGGFVDLFYIASDNQLFNIIQIAESELLGSNLNQLLSSNCHSLTGVSVVINITQDVVCAVASGSTKGFSFQLNAYSLKGSTCGYQQYVIALFGTELVCGIDNFTPDGKTLAHGIFKMGTLPSAKLAAGSQLKIDLGNDANANVDTATFSFLNQQGPLIKPVSKNIKSVAGGHSSALAPIVAFELDVVGPVNSENSILSSGAGTLTYQADQLLSPIDQPWIAGNPPVTCAESQLVTAEWANTTYSRMTAQRANPLSQTFSVVIDAKQAVSHAGHKRPSTRITAAQLKALTG